GGGDIGGEGGLGGVVVAAQHQLAGGGEVLARVAGRGGRRGLGDCRGGRAGGQLLFGGRKALTERRQLGLQGGVVALGLVEVMGGALQRAVQPAQRAFKVADSAAELVH